MYPEPVAQAHTTSDMSHGQVRCVYVLGMNPRFRNQILWIKIKTKTKTKKCVFTLLGVVSSGKFA